MDNSPLHHCLNCGEPLPPAAQFCPACGQKNSPRRIGFKQLFTDFIDNVFNLDSSFFLTVRKLLIPGLLTVEYFNGRRKTYLHPFRIFLLSLIFFVAAISWKINDGISREGDIMQRMKRAQIERSVMLEIDSINQQYQVPGQPNELNSALDDFKKQVYQRNGLTGDSLDVDHYFTLMNEDFSPMHIDDIFTLNTEQLMEKYQIEGAKREWIFQQKMKVMQDSRTFIRYLIGRISWFGLILIPLLALALKLLYWGSPFYFVEHFIFSIHTHSVYFILLALQLLVLSFLPVWTLAFSFVAFGIYLLLALHRFYRQGWGLTILKFVVLVSFVYWLVVSLSLMAAIVLGILFF